MTTYEEFAIERSKVIDAFAEAEEAIVARLARARDDTSSKASLTQKLQALWALEPSCALSRDIYDQLRDVRQRFEQAVEARNDLVHASMKIVELEEPTALYRNARCVTSDYQTARTLTLACHRRLRRDAEAIREILTPPSPPPPSPGAAAGP